MGSKNTDELREQAGVHYDSDLHPDYEVTYCLTGYGWEALYFGDEKILEGENLRLEDALKAVAKRLEPQVRLKVLRAVG